MKADVTHSSKSILRIPTSLIFIKELALNSIFFIEIDIIFYLSGDVRGSLLSVNVTAYFISYCSYVIVKHTRMPLYYMLSKKVL